MEKDIDAPETEKTQPVENPSDSGNMENVTVQAAAAGLPAETSGKDIQKKEPKKEKQVPAKKLPGILKKNYKAGKIEKKLYKRIFVSSDLELVKSFFVENPKKPGFLYIPRDTLIGKKSFKRMKLIGKQVAKQKASFKLIPFLAVVAFIAALFMGVVTFKNVIAKKALVAAMQGAFGARTDVARINVEILGSSVRIEGLQQANKDSPMKNLFQFDVAEIDFNLTEALRGKFDAENIEISGLAINTDRTYSGELPEDQKKKAKAKEKEQKEKSEFTLNLELKKDEALKKAEKSVKGIFAEYDPRNVIANLQSQLKSPQVAQEVQQEVEGLIEKWKDTPSEMEKQVLELTQSVNDVVNTNWSEISDIEQIRTAVTTVNAAIEKSRGMYASVNRIVEDVKSDAKRVQSVSVDVKDALQSDYNLVNDQIKKIKSFSIKDGTTILTDSLDTFLYDMIGKYYPYIKTGVGYAMEAKAKSDASKKKVEVKPENRHVRSKGRNVYYKKDRVPKFLIERIAFSGFGVTAKGLEISSDMDKRGKPASAETTFTTGNQNHKANLIVDARTVKENPLVAVNYSGDNYAMNFSVPYFGMDSSGVVNALCNVSDAGDVSVKADFDIQKLHLYSEHFEPDFAYRLYETALSSVKQMTLGAAVEWLHDGGLKLRVTTDLDKQFNLILKDLVNAELNILKNEALKQINLLLDDQTAGVMREITEFLGLEEDIDIQNMNMNRLKTKLEAKGKELQAELEKRLKAAASDALKNAVSSNPALEKVTQNVNLNKIPGAASIPGLDAVAGKKDESAASQESQENAAPVENQPQEESRKSLNMLKGFLKQ